MNIITLFVYGTLKRGYRNHNHYCHNAHSNCPAKVWGRLYQLPAGYPAMEVPHNHIFAIGSIDPLADAAIQARTASELVNNPVHHQSPGDWDLIHGELITFINPVYDLPPIDGLEGFSPGQQSLYQRVLVPVGVDLKISCAWTYVFSEASRHPRLPNGIWPNV
jgi:gamma-glutamylcyclotransferase (GGCT)/AIG2-like uncharacterized protein YtfP